MSTFVQRLLEFDFVLDQNPQTTQTTKFSESQTDSLTVSNVRASVRIENNGAPAGCMAYGKIWGLSQSVMNDLTTIGITFNSVQKNTIVVRAGDAINGLSQIFAGTIQQGYGDYSQQPDVPFVFTAISLLLDRVSPISATSFPQATDVASTMQNFASKLHGASGQGLTFENNGVTGVKVPPIYLPGNLWQQMYTYAESVPIRAEVVDGGTKLAIMPVGGSRTGLNVPVIAPPPVGQMIGYPSFASQQGIVVKNVFDKGIQFMATIQIQSSLKPANNTWVVGKMDLALESLLPNGEWMQVIHGFLPGTPIPVV